MRLLDAILILPVWAASAASSAVPPYRGDSFGLVKRQANSTGGPLLQVDLGYEIYGGYYNATSNLNIFRGIRFAAPPVGNLRWQAPQTPTVDRSAVKPANTYGSVCPQTPNTSPTSRGTLASEDCLFLNVWTPANTTGPLPVLVWIHGGGYGAGNGRQDLSAIINANGGNFVGVSIQYRLGAFGFLSSDEVFRNGVVNAGLLDQTFALQWVQSYIDLFGGDPRQVTISGESAGGGSVMLQAMAYGGSLGESLFVNSIAASPYLPMQYEYKDWIPSQSYYAFATYAGCPPARPYGYANSSETIFQCLLGKDSTTLQYASFNVSTSAVYGTWAFLPVTDGIFVQNLPTKQLTEKRVNGLRMLSGNNADEGPGFVPQNINSEQRLLDWLHLTFPLFTNDDIAKILLYYPGSNASDSATNPRFPTDGIAGATAVNQSVVGTGQQQRANNIYSETTFVCPSYWLAEAFTSKGREAYKYQYSVPIATHAADVAGYFGPRSTSQSQDFSMAFMNIWGNFVTKNNPNIPTNIANGMSSSNPSGSNAASAWTPFNIFAPYQLNLNATDITYGTLLVNGQNRTVGFASPNSKNDFSLVNAYTWEGGRGTRCDFWKSVGAIVPE